MLHGTNAAQAIMQQTTRVEIPYYILLLRHKNNYKLHLINVNTNITRLHYFNIN